MQLDFYYAKKEDEIVSYHFNETVKLLNKGWQRICVNNIAKHLNVLSDTSKDIGLVINDHYIILDQLLRGRKEISVKLNESFNNLRTTLEGLNKVIVHREQFVYEKVFSDDSKKMRPKI